MKRLILQTPNEKQKLFLADHHRHVGFGGARGGGKSWSVRNKAIRLCLRYDGIKVLIIRRTYPELLNNHINPLQIELHGIAKYHKTEKVFTFPNGSTIKFGYCNNDSDLGQYQGAEYDVIFMDEATQLQKALTDGSMAIDGLAGMETSSAVADWQRDHNRPVTGRADLQTLHMILAVSADQNPTNENWWDGVQYFSRNEFRCKCGRYCDGFPAEPNKLLIRHAEQVREYFGAPVHVSSGVRCERHNANVGGAEGSRHKRGKAMDFRVEGQSAKTVLAYVKSLPDIRYAYAIDGSFVHMDVE